MCRLLDLPHDGVSEVGISDVRPAFGVDQQNVIAHPVAVGYFAGPRHLSETCGWADEEPVEAGADGPRRFSETSKKRRPRLAQDAHSDASLGAPLGALEAWANTHIHDNLAARSAAE